MALLNEDPASPVASPATEPVVPRIGFIWILDRRQPDTHAGIVRQACAALPSLRGFLLGLDLAGDEGTHAPERLADSFLPAFAECLPITIHAGEGEQAENIWKAAYHLHADRIGHGLTLASHPALAAVFATAASAWSCAPPPTAKSSALPTPMNPPAPACPATPCASSCRQAFP